MARCNSLRDDGAMPPPHPAQRPIRRGDVYWIEAAPAALSDAAALALGGVSERAASIEHAHPHVVVSDDVFNHSRITTVVVCALTTNLQRGKEPGNVLLDDGEGDLPKRSVVVVSQISSVAKADLGAFIGSLAAARVDEIIAGLIFLQRSYFDRSSP